MTWSRRKEGAMPKMYKIVSGGSFTWEYVDTDNKDKVLARSTENWDSKQLARQAIDEMRTAKIKDDKPEGK
jgi:Ni,Fe-hydrogenase III large subunit